MLLCSRSLSMLFHPQKHRSDASNGFTHMRSLVHNYDLKASQIEGRRSDGWRQKRPESHHSIASVREHERPGPSPSWKCTKERNRIPTSAYSRKARRASHRSGDELCRMPCAPRRRRKATLTDRGDCDDLLAMIIAPRRLHAHRLHPAQGPLLCQTDHRDPRSLRRRIGHDRCRRGQTSSRTQTRQRNRRTRRPFAAQ